MHELVQLASSEWVRLFWRSTKPGEDCLCGLLTPLWCPDRVLEVWVVAVLSVRNSDFSIFMDEFMHELSLKTI